MLTADRARQLLAYDPATGRFTWLVNRAGTARAGSLAGSADAQGYHVIRVDGELYKAHRLALLISRGSWPADEVDHVNGIRNDNRMQNLREVTKQQNAQNRVLPPRHNRSGVAGVHWFARDSKWLARITVCGKRRSLGLYTSFDAAVAARRAAESLLLTHAPERT